MSRDKVKTELAAMVLNVVRGGANILRYRLAAHNVQDAEVTQVSDLEIQVKVIFRGMPPRYFIVKVQEKL